MPVSWHVVTDGLRLYDTMTGAVRDFVPLRPGHASIYLCGATVQGLPHIGHVRSGVAFDVLRRWLTAKGYDVAFIRNVTDIDDKILNKAADAGRPWWEWAATYERAFSAAYDALGVLPPSAEPRATGHITQMVELIERLIERGHAYAGNGDVYFDVLSLPDYGKLSGHKIDDVHQGEGVARGKRDERDFTLWKGAKPGEPTWASPWGPGRPGWHIECSAMAGKYLGIAFDIHGGGEDLIFPHHENEIAQSEGATGQPFARYWLHNAFLELKGEKMAKSVGNVVSPRELLRRHRGVVLRYALLGAHYRSPLEFSEEVLDDAAASYDRLATFATNAARALSGQGAGEGDPAADPSGPRARFQAALDDDLNVPAALAVLFDLVAEANPLIGKLEHGDTAVAGELRERFVTFLDLTARLGFTPLDDLPDPAAFRPLLELLLDLRERARAARDFAAADAIRDRLADAGIRVEDRPGGPRWHLIP